MRFFKDFITLNYAHLENLKKFDNHMEELEKEIKMWRLRYLKDKELNHGEHLDTCVLCSFLLSKSEDIYICPDKALEEIREKSNSKSRNNDIFSKK